MITASLHAQYGLRVYSEDFATYTWDEFASLVSGIGPETPLGRIVSIRAEKDQSNIKNFTPGQRAIWRDWQLKMAKEKPQEETEQFYMSLLNMFKGL